MDRKSTERFSDVVDNYVKYRPSYPPAVVERIDQHAADRGLPRMAADVGSGTGIFTRDLLSHGWTVHAIEPNGRMRAIAEQAFTTDPHFISRDATAEDTRLRDSSISVITAAQAFHWFDLSRCQVEWRRVLAPGGFVCLVWNIRRLGSPFMDAYESLLVSLLPEYREVTQRNLTGSTLRQFLTGGVETTSVPHSQTFQLDGLIGRVLSSSYAPTPSDPSYEPLLSGLRDLFEAHQRDGHIDLLYDTEITIGVF